MKRVLSVVAVYMLFFVQSFAQHSADLQKAFMYYEIYSMTINKELLKESVKTDSHAPDALPLAPQVIDSCIEYFSSHMKAVLIYHKSNMKINGVQQPGSYQVQLTSVVAGCSNTTDMVFNGNWTYVKNQKNENILTADNQTIDKENRFALMGQHFTYILPIAYKEGDTQPVQVRGNLQVTIPSRLALQELTAKDIDRQVAFGANIYKLLEVNGNAYAIEMSANDQVVKFLPVNDAHLEFASNISRAIPLYYYEAFRKKQNITGDELAAIQQGFDKSDTRIVRFGTVSGTIHSIMLYRAAESVTRQVNIDLTVKP